MPTQQDINEIASYLKSFEDGTRNHDQYTIHGCGSSHCLAGWKAYDDAVDDYVDTYPIRTYEKLNELKEEILATGYSGFVMDW